jgi:hypothetical protein
LGRVRKPHPASDFKIQPCLIFYDEEISFAVKRDFLCCYVCATAGWLQTVTEGSYLWLWAGRVARAQAGGNYGSYRKERDHTTQDKMEIEG